MVFDEYAQYYDVLYQDKDYEGEAKYIAGLLKKYAPTAENLADLGCGTGKHAELLTSYGYTEHGVDMSEDMLRAASRRAEGNDKLSFSCASLQDFTLEKPADAVTALFHVMSYQSTDAMVCEALRNIHGNVREGGTFIFDLWYGPAVLLQRPEFRVKRMESPAVKVTRIAEPVIRENENIVEVHYDVFVENKAAKTIHEIREKHVMRYFFKDEIVRFLKDAGFKLVDSFEFMTGNPLSKDTWGSCFVAQKQ